MKIFKNKQNKEEVVVESTKDLETLVVTEEEIKEFEMFIDEFKKFDPEDSELYVNQNKCNHYNTTLSFQKVLHLLQFP